MHPGIVIVSIITLVYEEAPQNLRRLLSPFAKMR
jgi:hypothetical protein